MCSSNLLCPRYIQNADEGTSFDRRKMYFSLPVKKSPVLSKSRYDLQIDILDEYEN